MKTESKNIWTRPRGGACGAWLGAAMIFVTGGLFAAAATALVYLIHPQGAYNLVIGRPPLWVWETPGMVPVLIALQAMGLWLALAAVVSVVYDSLKRLVGWAVRRVPLTIIILPKTCVSPCLREQL